MSATESEYNSTGETSPKDSSPKNPRPQSIMAANFADQLNDIFLLNDDLDQLTNSVDNKRFSLTPHNAELEALQARLKRTEELLEQKRKRLSLPSSPTEAPPIPETSPTEPSSDNAPPIVVAPPPPRDEQAPEGKEGYVVVERSPSVVNGGTVPPIPTRMAPPVPVE